jgi:ABC-2 type transport system ATP-binding protein
MVNVILQNISKSFGSQNVLKNINLHVDDNEIFGLLGPSGAGKTTLIRLITGAIVADEGKLTIDKFEIPTHEALKIIGFMPQEDALYNDLSGLDNLLFFGGLYKLKKETLNNRIDEVLTLVDLHSDASKRVSLYSGGMKKRLSLSIALLHNPKLLILDEPTVGIDPLLRKKIWDEFFELKRQGHTIIVTTHVMDEAIKCDRLGLIYNGNLIECDTVKNLMKKTQNNMLEELFFLNNKEKGS